METETEPLHVVAPPPLLYLGSIVLGLVLQALLPWAPAATTGGNTALAHVVGGLLIVAGLVLAGAAAARMRRAGTALQPGHPATAMVTGGVYAVSRNPIYLGMTLFSAGIGIAAGAPWVLLLLAVVLPLMHYGVIAREEAYLTRTFGEPYLRYKRSVRRWI